MRKIDADAPDFKTCWLKDGCPGKTAACNSLGPYDDGCPVYRWFWAMFNQEPVTVHDPGALCPGCEWPLYQEDHPHYCGNCGRRLEWSAAKGNRV